MKKVYLSVAALLIISNVASANTSVFNSSQSNGSTFPWEAKKQGTGPLTCATGNTPINLHYKVTSFAVDTHGHILGGANIICNGIDGYKQIPLKAGAVNSQCTIQCNTMSGPNPSPQQSIEINSDGSSTYGAAGIMKYTYVKPAN